MEHPYYSVTVTNETRGWSYSRVEGVVPDTDVRLDGPLTIGWAFQNNLIPSAHMDPMQASVVIVARDAADVPDVAQGDRISIDLRVGLNGPRILAGYPFQANEPKVTLRAGTFRAQLTIALTDYSPDWRARDVGMVWNERVLAKPAAGARLWWRERLAEFAGLTGVSIGAPTWWADNEAPAPGDAPYLPSGVLTFILGNNYSGNLASNLEAVVNSHQPAALTHTCVTVHASSGHPAGYRRVGPDVWEPIPVPDPKPTPVINDPDTTVRIEIVPASRRASGAIGHPLTLTVVDDVLSVVARQPVAGGALTCLGLDADWCELPATARRARENNIGVVNVRGQGFNQPNGTDFEVADQTLTVANGQSATVRDLETQLMLAYPGQSRPAPWAAGSLHLSQAGDDGWSYDHFLVHSHLVPQDIAEWLLPRIGPRLPGEEDGDGCLVRHVTVFDVASTLRFQPAPLAGFITSGSLTLADGRMTWELDTAPGRPQWTDYAPPAITVAEFNTFYGTLHPADLDPHLTFADLDYVEAP